MDVKKINYLYKCKDGESGVHHNELSKKKPFHKKGRKNKKFTDKDLLIGEKFYETVPYFNDQAYDDNDYHGDFHSDYEQQSPAGPCVDGNCYQFYDPDIDRHMPGESQLVPSLLPGPQANIKNSNENNGITSWIASLFHW